MIVRGLLLEYMGTLLVIAALVFTHANPIITGLAYMSALFIADGRSDGFFTPLGVLAQYFLGRLTTINSLKLLGVQTLAVGSIVLVYKSNKELVN
jgi:hypothetical protein